MGLWFYYNEGRRLLQRVMRKPLTTCVLQIGVSSEALRYNLREQQLAVCMCVVIGGTVLIPSSFRARLLN